MNNRRGTTLIELLVVLTVVGILAQIAIPNYHSMIARADATRIIADFTTVRHAVYDYAAEGHTYPPNAAWGRVPSQISSHLPANFAFAYKSATYRWRRWSLPSGLARQNAAPALLGLQIRTTDRELLAAIRRQFKGRVTQVTRRQLTLVLE